MNNEDTEYPNNELRRRETIVLRERMKNLMCQRSRRTDVLLGRLLP